MVRVGMVGLGKMGLSHYAIFNSHPLVSVVAVCDANTYLTDVLSRQSNLKCYGDFDQMLAREQLDAVVIATPSKMHASMVGAALERGLHVFCEKPFVLSTADGGRLADLAEKSGLVNQVGYHYRFVGAFREAANVIGAGALGKIHHVRAEAYGPVVLKPKGGTWRSAKSEGGGALYDYACHALDLVNYTVGVPSGVSGVIRTGVFSKDVEDEVYCSLHFPGGASGQLAVNWSDESFRKMATKISVWGDNGRLVADRQECQIYIRSSNGNTSDLKEGWNVKYTTELTDEVWYYLRGEEYSAQVDYFVRAIEAGAKENINSFRSALHADRLVEMLLNGGSESAQSLARSTGNVGVDNGRGLWSRLFS